LTGNEALNVYSAEALEKYYRMRGKAKSKGKGKRENMKAAGKHKGESKIYELTGCRVKLYLRGGLTLEGVIRDVYTYDFILECSGKRLLVLKHTVDYIELL